MRALLLHVLNERSSKRPLLSGSTELLQYLRLDMAWERVERTRILFLDARCRLIRDETMWIGTLDATPFYVREIVQQGLLVGAAHLIVVHNHPSGDPIPTPDDIARTRELHRCVQGLQMSLIDHIIVAEAGHFSMRAAGMLHG